MPEIESENQFLTSIKGRNSVLICQNLPLCNSRTLLSNIISHSKFEENWLKMLQEKLKTTCADGRTDVQTDGPTDKPKAICPFNFSIVEGIMNIQDLSFKVREKILKVFPIMSMRTQFLAYSMLTFYLKTLGPRP